MNELHTTTVADGLAAVERSVAVKESGVLVTLTITTDAPGETAVMVTDTVPSAVDAAESGFHPNFSPGEGSVNDNRVVFAETITAAAPLQVIYGMVVDADTISVAWDRYSLSLDAVAPEPSAVTPEGEARSYAGGEFEADEGDDEQMIPSEDTPDPVRREVTDVEPALDADAADGVSAGQLFAGMEAADMSPPEPDEPEEPADPPLLDDDADEPALEPAVTEIDEESADTDGPADTGEPDDEPVVSIDDLTDEESEESAAEPSESEQPDEDGRKTPEPAADEESEPAASVGDGPAVDASADEPAETDSLDVSSVSVGDALAAEIRDGGLDDETRETLSNAFGPGLSPDQQAQLNRIQSRVEELSEAVAPLDELLDEENPAVALADLRADIDDLREAVEELSAADGSA